MRIRQTVVALGVLALLTGVIGSLGAVAAAAGAGASGSGASGAGPSGSASSGSGSDQARACTTPTAPGLASCGAIELLDPQSNWQGTHLPAGATDPENNGPSNSPGGGKRPGGGGGGGTSGPAGYYPADLLSAYGLTSIAPSAGGGQTVAVVDAYDDPNAESDLNTYRSHFGLAPCTSANGCFTKYEQPGTTANTSWSEEISVDLDMVSAICPNCHILLVEASSAYLYQLNSQGVATGLGPAAAYAAANANAVSNSYGASEFSSETSYDSYYEHSGVAITAAAGDGGYGVDYPAASPYVVSVGGTTLQRDTSLPRGWTESVWSGTGSGCSAYEANPGWQPVTSLCGNRTVGDVAADANPNTGVAVYDSYGEPGWMVFGGTSVASPIAASVFALAGNASSFTVDAAGSDAAQALYTTSSLNKVTSGSNSRHCDVYLCNAADSLSGFDGYNGPTGNGTPAGTAGF